MELYCLPGGILNANTYVLYQEGSDSAVIIDPTDFDNLDAFLIRKNLHPIAILLTHGHFDHVSGMIDTARHYDIPVYLHSGDVPMLSDPQLCGLRLFFPDAAFEPWYEVSTVTDGQVLSLGGITVQVFSTPGHSPGSVCYLVEEHLFSGDTLFKRGYGRTDLWGGSMRALLTSLDRLKKMDSALLIHPGHGDATTIGEEFRYKR